MARHYAKETDYSYTFSKALYKEIDRLPEIYRTAVVVCHLEGLSHNEAAARLGCPLRTIQSRLLRARHRLRARRSRRDLILPIVLPHLETPMITPVWAEAMSRSTRAFARGNASGAVSAGVAPAAITLATSSPLARSARTSVALVATALIAGGVAVSVALAALRGTEARPNPPGTSFKSPDKPNVAQQAKDPTNRTLELRIVGT